MKYLKEREQFGHPLADFQHLRFKVADMAAQIEACRQLMYTCARRSTRVVAVTRKPRW